MQQKDIKAILEKVQSGNHTPEDEAIAKYWLHQLKLNEQVDLTESDLDQISQEVWSKLPQPAITPIRRLPVWAKMAAAASIVLALSAGLYLIKFKKSSQQIAQNKVQDIGPGSNKLFLTLSNGKKIDLNSAKIGQVAVQGKAAISKVSNGQIAYTAINNNTQELQYNTVSAPRGGTGAITLSDGTKVWLNAESSITFPTTFKGGRRIVSITGDVIIKPVLNAKIPFYTHVKNQVIKDIGTEFDINAYDNEPVIRTTLIEGSVSIVANGKAVTLKPGQQSILNGDEIKVESANIRDATAWRDGELRCDGENIQTIMRMIERWYNVEVIYQGEISADGYYGTISRYKNISQALHMLSYSNQVHFKVEGRRVTVTD